MSNSLRRAVTGACLLVSTAAATASPVVLDTEQKVRDVDTFYYDVGNWLHAFYPLGQCQGP